MDPERRRDVIRLSAFATSRSEPKAATGSAACMKSIVTSGRIVALMSGPGSLIERLTARTEGRRIPWECVDRIGRGDGRQGDPPRGKRS